MPVIVLTGFPSSGKTKIASELKKFFESQKINVNLISENDVLSDLKMCKNEAFADSGKEKQVRSIVKTLCVRAAGPETLTIVDALNYIKGYRYEVFCASKSAKTTQCTIHCRSGKDVCRKYNLGRSDRDRYDEGVFEGLVSRYEPPDSRNKWDFPLFHVVPHEPLPLEQIRDSLYLRKPPPPNQSTQCPPVSDTNFLHELDILTEEVISVIASAKKLNLEGEVRIPGCEKAFVLSSEKNSQLPELLRWKRQFLSYVKLHPTLYNSKDLKNLFVQYLNTNL